jgi:hypothetical protein
LRLRWIGEIGLLGALASERFRMMTLVERLCRAVEAKIYVN